MEKINNLLREIFLSALYAWLEWRRIKLLICRSNDFNQYYQLGVVYKERKKLATSEKMFRKAIAFSHRDIRAHYELAEVLKHQGKNDESAAMFNKVIELNPKDKDIAAYYRAYYQLVGAHYELGVIYKDKGEIKEAIEMFNKVIELHLHDAGAHYHLGIIYKDKGKIEEAIEMFKKVIEFNPRDVGAHHELGRIYKDRGEIEEATEMFEKTIEFNSRDVGAHYELGMIYKDKGEIEEATEMFKKTIEFNPRDVGAHHELGRIYKDRGEIEEAIEMFKKTIEFNPRDVGAHYELGRIYKDRGEIEEATEMFEKTIEFNSRDVGAHYELGMIYKDRGEIEEAIVMFKKTIEFNPRDVGAHYELGRIYKDRGEIEEAIEMFRKLGVIYKEEGKRDKATEVFKKTIEFNPKDVGAHYELGMIYKDKGKIEEAMEMFRKLGVIYEEEGKLDKATEVFKKTIEINPKDVGAHYELGMIYKDKGKIEEATEMFKKTIEINPKYVEARNQINSIYANCEHNNIEKIAETKLKYDYFKKDKKREIYKCNICKIIFTSDRDDLKTLTQFYNKDYFTGENELKEAINLFRRAIELKPNDVRAHFNLGRTHLEKSNYYDALNEFEKVLDLDPENVSGYVEKGKTHLILGQLEEAEQSLKEAINRNSKNIGAYVISSRLYEKKDEIKKAFDSLITALKLEPRDIGIHNKVRRFLDGINDENLRSEYDKFCHQNNLLKEAKELDRIFLDSEEVEQENERLRNTIKINEKDSSAHFNLGILYKRYGDMNRALDEFKIVLELNPKNVEVLIEKGIVHKELAKGVGYFQEGRLTASHYQWLHKHYFSMVGFDDVEWKRKRYLEVGCAVGRLLSYMKKRGWDIYGIELSQWAVDYCKKELNLANVYCCELEEASFPDNYFDFVAIIHTLEHLVNPMNALKEVYRILSVDGMLFIEVPDADRDKDYWVSDHFWFFTSESLHNWLSGIGFKDIRIFKEGIDCHFSNRPFLFLSARK